MTDNERIEMLTMMQEVMKPLLESTIDNKFDEKLKPINDRLQSLEQGQRSLEQGQKSLEQGQKSLEQGQKSLEQGQKSLEQGQKSLEQDLKTVATKVTALELKIENEIDRAIKSIAEGHTDLYRKLEENNALENRVETLEHKMSAVEYAIKN